MTALASEHEKVLCKNCRLEFDFDALFCPNCGTAKARDLSGDPIVGTTVGDRYQIIKQIGQGTSGAIYLGEHVTLRRKVVVKVLHHELSRDDLAIERFRREATTVGELDNDHIVQIYDFGRILDGRLYLAMEYLEGKTLAEILEEEGRLDTERVVDLLTQLGEALIEAHAMGYVHRDLRPRNLFLAMRRTRANYLKLFDFGLAKLVEQEGEAATTSLGMTFGDPHYMSPEQARGDAVDRRADIYSMGCIAYQMLTGKPPFHGGKVFDVLTRHVEEAPRPLAEVAPETPPWLERAIMRCLAKKPEDRYITVYRLVEALRQGTDSGVIMSDEIARRRPTNPPASVSRAMERVKSMGKEAAPPSSPASAPESVEPAAPSEELSGAETEPSDAPVVATPSATKSPVGSQTVMGVGLVGEPSKIDLPIKVEPSVELRDSVRQVAQKNSEPAKPVSQGLAPTLPSPNPGPTVRSSEAQAFAIDEITGERSFAGESADEDAPSEVAQNSESSSGLSAVWYADGDTMEDGGRLSEQEIAKLDKARGNTPSRTGLMAVADDEYFDELPGNSRVKVAAGIVVALGAVVALAAILLSGGEKSKDGEDKNTSEAKPVAAIAAESFDAAPVIEPIDAGAAVAEVAPDAGAAAVAVVTEPKPSAVTEPRTRDPKPRDVTPKPRVRDPKPEPRVRDPKPEPRVRDPKPNPIDVSSGPTAGEKEEAQTLIAQGSSDLRSGDILGAAAKFNKARSLDPKNASAYAGLGNIALSQGAYPAAIGHLKKASKMRPKSAQIWTLLGEAYLGAGNQSQAANAFKRSLQIRPDNARARDGYNEATGN